MRYLAGAALAVAAVYACVTQVDWPQFASAFRTAHLSWLVAAFVSVFLTLGLVTIRWGVLVNGDGRTEVRPYVRRTPAPRWRPLWDAVVVGQAVNIVVPLRFGEGARVAITSRELDLPIAQVLMSVAVERAIDILAFGTAAFVLVSTGWMPRTIMTRVPGIVGVVFAIAAAFAIAVRLWPALLTTERRWLGSRWGLDRWIAAQATNLQRGWAGVTRGPQLTQIVLLSVAAFLSSAATNVLVLRAFDMPVPIMAALVLLLALQVGTAIVSVPGNLGVFHYITVVTLALWHVPRPEALAVAVVLHVVSLGPKVALGAIALLSTRRRQEIAPVAEGSSL
jgi:uncharacterized protein (TIRG00374 family)